MNKQVEILNVPFIHTTHKEFLNEITSPHNHPIHVVTANPEIVMYAKEHPEYMRTIKQSDYIIADGIGIIIASKMINKPLPERIPGFELMDDLLNYSNEHKKRIYLLGAKEHVVRNAQQQIKEKYPNLTIAGYHHGYIDTDNLEVVEEIRQSEADFIFVALGYPKQEEWITRHKAKLNKGVLMGVGGSFDIWAGEAKRAPKIWLKLNLEWLYRLLTNPTRLKRMLKLPQFLIHVLRGK
ncbi:WecB/TagA/CpsF family glycosyltransferase [Aquisalibacillus elongatus]|nr:WecB/TagA/CpsF family glycosyltransferase [Aquisalibacillus elongatus]